MRNVLILQQTFSFSLLFLNEGTLFTSIAMATVYGAGSRLGWMTLAQRHRPIRGQLLCRTDVTHKAKRTVSWWPESPTAPRRELRSINRDFFTQTAEELQDSPSVTGPRPPQFMLRSKKQLKPATKILLGAFPCPFG